MNRFRLCCMFVYVCVTGAWAELAHGSCLCLFPYSTLNLCDAPPPHIKCPPARWEIERQDPSSTPSYAPLSSSPVGSRPWLCGRRCDLCSLGLGCNFPPRTGWIWVVPLSAVTQWISILIPPLIPDAQGLAVSGVGVGRPGIVCSHGHYIT